MQLHLGRRCERCVHGVMNRLKHCDRVRHGLEKEAGKRRPAPLRDDELQLRKWLRGCLAMQTDANVLM